MRVYNAASAHLFGAHTVQFGHRHFELLDLGDSTLPTKSQSQYRQSPKQNYG
jgi:hypothetical protein